MLGSHTLFYAALLSVNSLASAQTIIDGGATVEANSDNVLPAAEPVSGHDWLPEESVQLTSAVLSNLTDLDLTNITYFDFDDSDSAEEKRSILWPRCKSYPGDLLYPIDIAWNVFNLLLGGRLIKTVPVGAPCYDQFGRRDEAKCATVAANWGDALFHIADPTSVMRPIWQGLTCLHTGNFTDRCELGGFPSYVVQATNVAHIQLAVNFARTLNLRLVVKNTGHDFNGRSLGAGALSIWTNKLKSIKFHKEYKTSDYTGPALQVSAGVLSHELYEAADKYGVTAVGGEGYSVGWAGGYLAGGGHSPMSSMYGLGADQILNVEVVTPDGRFVTANEKQNTELFWALRGGGGSTFGVVTSYTVKAHPKIPVTVANFSFGISATLSRETFWEGVRAFWEMLPVFNDAGNYQYWNVFNFGPEFLQFGMAPWFAPGMTVEEVKNLTAPLFAKWASLGIEVDAQWTEHARFLPAYRAGFHAEAIGGWNVKTASRIFPRENFVDPVKFNETFNVLKTTNDQGGQLIGFGITGGPGPHPDNAVNDAWRDAAMFCITGMGWDDNAPLEEMARLSKKLTEEWMEPWRQVAPNSGSYASEGDVSEPDWQKSFYGQKKYDRLYALKQKIDPKGLFYAHMAVGSEDWYVTDQLPGLPTQNGRLCRVQKRCAE